MKRSERYALLESALAERILVLDGAMGTMIQRRRPEPADFHGERFAAHPVSLAGDNDILNLTRPDIVAAIHDAYLEAGADIVETNTFNSTGVSQAEYGLASIARELSRAGARIARDACDRAERADSSRPRFAAGSVGPTGKTLSLSPDAHNPGRRAIDFDSLEAAYLDSILGLIEGGADIILVETVFDTLNAKAAVRAARKAFESTGIELPLMISGTITDAAGRTLSGQTAAAFWYSLEHARPVSIGFNCSLGAADLVRHVSEVGRLASCALSLHPNAGMPNELGQYDDTPGNMARVLGEFVRRPDAPGGKATGEGANIVGGCCGTTPDHIRAIAEAVRGVPPRRAPVLSPATRLCGLEPLVVDRESLFVNVGERTNVAGSRAFARLVREGRYAEAVEIARLQVEAGAQAVDVNLDDALLDSEAEMGRFLDLLASEPDIARVPVMIDSSDWKTILAGLKRVQGKGIVNSISLKEGEAAFLEKAREIRGFGAAALVMAFDEHGQADTLERRIATCARSYRLLREEAGFPPGDIILDPNVFAVGTGMEEHRAYALDYMKAASWIKKHLPGALVSGGVSNVSFSFRGNDALRSAIHAVFLFHARAAGMDMGIVNPAQLVPYDEIPPEARELVEDLVLDRRPDATERLLESASVFQGAVDPARDPEWRSLPVEDRIVHALAKGVSGHIVADVLEIRPSFARALDVIEGPLMKGMDLVGRLFGEGRMFLPQVVKSARVMREAVAALLPFIEEEKSAGGSGRGGMVIATVKGDVHDIGKNIVSVVLSCNNYRVTDLGVMVPAESILEAAERTGADVIGLSGLITPSLEEMSRIAALMEERGMKIPLLVGGATTNPVHTALRIAPAYSGPVVHVADASLAPGVLEQLLNPAKRTAFVEELGVLHERRRTQHRAKQDSLRYLALEEARARRFRPERAGWTPEPPAVPDPGVLRYSTRELAAYIDWTYFFLAWEMQGRYPAILDDPATGAEARRLLADARALLALPDIAGATGASCVCGFFPAASRGDDILVYADESRSSVRAVVPCLRQQRRKEDGSPSLCHADYLHDEGSRIPDWIGAFAVTAGTFLAGKAAAFSATGDEYRAISLKILADRLAEAAAERLHEEVRTRFWGYAPDERLGAEGLFQVGYRGIRPAPGYPPCPDHREKRTIFDLLGARAKIGIDLTETCMMTPPASVSGWYFAHPDSKYFAVGRIGRDQAEDFARRRGEPTEETERWLRTELNYEPE